MEIERSIAPITIEDLNELYTGSIARLIDYYHSGRGVKWKELYNIQKPLAAALCQGAAMHYHDKENGVKDFDVWFFYPFNQKHLPYRSIWNWDYTNPKFGRHPEFEGYSGRRVDVLVRSIKNYTHNDPVKTMHQFLQHENTSSARLLGKKAVVLLSPESSLGKVVCYKDSYFNP